MSDRWGGDEKPAKKVEKQGVQEHWDRVWMSGQLPTAAGAEEGYERHCERGTGALDNTAAGKRDGFGRDSSLCWRP